MTTIRLETIIQAPINRCFDLSRNLDLHRQSMTKFAERAIDGKLSGLINQGEWVTWEATHFMVRQRLTTSITKMDSPVYFQDAMIKGAFKTMVHDHFFRESDPGTVMTDVFRYETPFGLFGSIFDYLFLESHMTRLLQDRNRVIKAVAERHSTELDHS